MPRKYRAHSNSNVSISKGSILSFLVIVLLVVGGYFGGQALGYWGAAPAPTNMSFLVVDYASGLSNDETDAVNIYVYGLDTFGMTESEIEDTLPSEWTLDAKVLNSGDTFTPETDADTAFIYMIVANGTDFVQQSFVPVLGLNIIHMMNETEDVSELAFSTPAFSTTVNQTDYDTWTLNIETLDRTEGINAKTTSVEGYMSNMDFLADQFYCIVVRLTLNTTATTAMTDLANVDAEEVISTVYVYYEIDMTLMGSASFDIELGSGLGSTFELVQIAIGYGNSDAFSAWDTQ